MCIRDSFPAPVLAVRVNDSLIYKVFIELEYFCCLFKLILVVFPGVLIFAVILCRSNLQIILCQVYQQLLCGADACAGQLVYCLFFTSVQVSELLRCFVFRIGLFVSIVVLYAYTACF